MSALNYGRDCFLGLVGLRESGAGEGRVEINDGKVEMDGGNGQCA